MHHLRFFFVCSLNLLKVCNCVCATGYHRVEGTCEIKDKCTITKCEEGYKCVNNGDCVPIPDDPCENCHYNAECVEMGYPPAKQCVCKECVKQLKIDVNTYIFMKVAVSLTKKVELIIIRTKNQFCHIKTLIFVFSCFHNSFNHVKGPMGRRWLCLSRC